VHQGRLELHPSDQVRGYVEYCRRFHSAVEDHQASVDGCVLFTGWGSADPYRASPHDQLAASFPVFTVAEERDTKPCASFLRTKLTRPDAIFAAAFDQGCYRQDRNFVRQVAQAIRDESRSPFVLLDEQRRGFQYCLHEIEKLIRGSDGGKLVIVIEGPPGSGKSVLAANLWASLALDVNFDGNVVLTTTSSAQKSNWRSLFELVAKESAGRGLVVPSNQYNPGLTSGWLAQQRERGHAMKVADWKSNVALYLGSNQNRAPDDHFTISIVDEAHALIDPTAAGAEGVQNSGWCMQAGPQAWHIIRASRVSVFLMDPEQSYRDNETTRRVAIDEWARERGAQTVHGISLADAQFRCGGSKEYTDWMEALLGLSRDPIRRPAWRETGGPRSGPFAFEIASDPANLEQYLRKRLKEGRSARLVSSYARKWVTKGIGNPHDLSDLEKDFAIPYESSGEQRLWAKVWNFVPEEDYATFIQGPPGSRIHDDPLCEVGCPYVIRGFDFDYLGVLWLSDLVRRGNRWVVDTKHVHEIALRKTLAGAKGVDRGNAREVLLRRLQRGYRILLSRAIRGLCLWFEDEETKAYVLGVLAGNAHDA